LTKQLLWSFLGVLILVLGIVYMMEIIELLRKISKRGDIDTLFALEMTLAKIPRVIDIVFPFVMMIAAMVTFWKVSKSNEYVIVRASGVSIWGFLKPVLIATFVIGAINVALINPISSYLYEVYDTYQFRLETKNPDAMIFTDMGLWIREASDKDTVVVVKASRLRQEEGRILLSDVTILEMDRNSQIKRRIEGFIATLDGNKFNIKDAKIYMAGKEMQELPSLEYKTTLTKERIKDSFVDPEGISFWKLPGLIHFYQSAGFAVQKHYMRYWTLIASPFLLCAMVLMAAVFSLQANVRKGGVLYMVVSGICAGFLIYFFSQIIYTFGMNDYIPLMLAVWTPTLVVSMVSVSVLLHLEDG